MEKHLLVLCFETNVSRRKLYWITDRKRFEMFRAINILVIVSLISGCVTPFASTYISPEVEGQAQEQLAILDWRDCLRTWGIGCHVSLLREKDEQQVEMVSNARDFNQAKLPPGNYLVYVYSYLTSGKFKDIQSLALYDQVTLEPGRKYLVNKSLWTADISKQYTDSWWIEDAESGEAIAGGKPPEHLPGFKYHLFYR